jgi:SanA protein
MKRIFQLILKIGRYVYHNFTFLFSLLCILIFVIFIVSENIVGTARLQCYDKIEEIPYNETGLLLGTSNYIGKKPNYYYVYRINAAVELYQAGKIKNILVSGDNRQHNYNEPLMIKRDLIKRGIPEQAIFLDYAGFRTFDSVIRCKKVFGQNNITIISQRFHNERAIFIANHNEINAVGYNAKELTGRYGLKTRIRERFARIKAVLDVFILNTQPKFLGEKITIQ